MTKQEFWSLMDNCRSADMQLYFEALDQAVSELRDADRKDFRAFLGAYMNAVNECVWLDMACKVINGCVSDDTALYFTLWVIAQGESVLLNAIKDPDTLADLPEIPFHNADFEMLMGIGFDEDEALYDYDEDDNLEIFEEMDDMLSGEIGIMVPPQIQREVLADIAFKNGDKYGNFKSFEDAMDAIPKHLPRLLKRAREIGIMPELS